MKFVKPFWVHHDGGIITSIDLNPTGTKLCTGGSIEKRGCVYLWDMNPIRDENCIDSCIQNRLTAKMEVKTRIVQVVRWSPATGKHLVSGGSDKIITFWRLVKVKNKDEEMETWAPDRVLRGHSGEILGVEWSNDEALLASCGADRNIIVWDARDAFCILGVLKGHTDTVTSICWDPAMCYIVSSANDQSLRFWRTSDWKQEVCVKKPFEKVTSHMSNLHWSPDGQKIISTHSIEHQASKAHVICRKNWESLFAFSGHCKPISVVRFSPKVMSSLADAAKSDQPYCCVALGSIDRSLSIWFSQCKHPLLILRDVFVGAINEISWSKGGNEVLACSSDGTICYLCLSEEEIGKPIPDTELDALILKNCFDSEQKGDTSILPVTTVELDTSQKKSKAALHRIKRNCAQIQTNVGNDTKKNRKTVEPVMEKKVDVVKKKGTLLVCQVPETNLVLEARNNCGVLQNELFCILRCVDVEINRELWQNDVKDNAVKLVANSLFVAVGCDDSSIYLFSTEAGSKLHSPFLVPGSIAVLRSINWNLFVLSTDHLCYYWHVKPPNINNRMNAVRVPKVFDASLIQISFLENSIPLLLYSNLILYVYNFEAAIWTKFDAPYPECIKSISPADSVERQSVFEIVSGLKTIPALIESLLNDDNNNTMDELTRLLLFGLLETHIINCVLFDIPSEFEMWILLTLKFLTRFNDNLSLSQLRIILSFFGNEKTSSFIKDNQSLEKLRTKILDILSKENYSDVIELFASSPVF